MKKLIKSAEKLIDDEYENATKGHGTHHSYHEAYAVLKEEIEEAETEIVRIKNLEHLLWRSVKNDDPESIKEMAIAIERNAALLIAETVQVGAMARKCYMMEGNNANKVTETDD